MKKKTSNNTTQKTACHVNAYAIPIRAGLALALGNDADALPNRLQVLAWGDNPNAHGKPVRVGRKLAAALQNPRYAYREIPLDYEHNTAPGTPAYLESKEPRPVAAYGAPEAIEGKGVFLNVGKWTKSGLENAGNYTDVSALVITDTAGEVVAIPSVALCRTGAVEGMKFAQVPLSAPIYLTEEPHTMDWKTVLAGALGLDPAAVTDEELVAALAEALKKPEVKQAAQDAVKEAITPLSAQIATLSKSVTGLEVCLLERDKQRALDAAAVAGKVVALSAEAIAKLSLQDLQEHIEKIPATVPLSPKTPDNLQEPTTGAITEQQRQIALNCGLDPEAVFGTKKETATK